MIAHPAHVVGQCLLLASVFMAGCATRGPVISVADTALPASIELEDTVFFPQQKYRCGPAALATVLTHADVESSPDKLVDLVYTPGRRGALQAEMLAAARGHGRIAYVLPPKLDALLAELAAGRPVLVLQNLGLRKLPIWHYAVLVGYDAADDSVILRSGTTRRLSMSARRFLDTWDRSGGWAFVVLDVDAVPAALERRRWLNSIAALERSIPPDALELAYTTYLARFPDDDTGTLGLANARLAQGRAREAEALYRELIARQPHHVVARNNLAWSLSGRNCLEEALEQVQAAIGEVEEHNEFYRRALQDTRRRIIELDGQPGSRCARFAD